MKNHTSLMFLLTAVLTGQVIILTGCAPVYEIPTTKTASVSSLTPKFKGVPIIKIELGKLEKVEIKGSNISVKNGSNADKGSSLTITKSSAQLDGKLLNTQFPIEVTSDNNNLEFNGKKFRGDLIVYNQSGKLLLVNRVDIESYLKGVVPCELKTKEMEALKAQIVASRSFAIRLIKPGDTCYNTTSGVESQVYKGVDAEVDFINKTIDETQGIVCTFKGEPIEAQYHSSCGGRTANGKAPYLKSTGCQFCKSYPNYRWECSFPKTTFFEKLGVEGNSFSITKDKSGRIQELTVPNANFTIKGEDLRTRLGIRSRFCDIKEQGDKIVIDGKGYGHGIGLCQYGAVGMAKKGFGFKSILKYYYSGIKIEKLY